MTDPDLVAFIRNYDIIFFIETMKGNIKMPVELLVVLAYLFQINMQI